MPCGAPHGSAKLRNRERECVCVLPSSVPSSEIHIYRESIFLSRDCSRDCLKTPKHASTIEDTRQRPRMCATAALCVRVCSTPRVYRTKHAACVSNLMIKTLINKRGHTNFIDCAQHPWYRHFCNRQNSTTRFPPPVCRVRTGVIYSLVERQIIP